MKLLLKLPEKQIPWARLDKLNGRGMETSPVTGVGTRPFLPIPSLGDAPGLV